MKVTSNTNIIGKLGVGAATLAGITGANAAIVQITLTGNQITENTSNLQADLTGDGVVDIALIYTHSAYVNSVHPASVSSKFSASVKISGGAPAYAFYVRGTTSSSSQFGIRGTITNDKLIAISFNDPAYGGAVDAWLDVHVDQHSPTSEAAVVLQRVIWDEDQPTSRPTLLSVSATDPAYAEATKVPEPSGIALLALGAGGLLLRRKRQA